MENQHTPQRGADRQVQLKVTVPEATRRRLGYQAIAEDRSRGEIVTEALRDYFRLHPVRDLLL